MLKPFRPGAVRSQHSASDQRVAPAETDSQQTVVRLSRHCDTKKLNPAAITVPRELRLDHRSAFNSPRHHEQPRHPCCHDDPLSSSKETGHGENEHEDEANNSATAPVTVGLLKDCRPWVFFEGEAGNDHRDYEQNERQQACHVVDEAMCGGGCTGCIGVKYKGTDLHSSLLTDPPSI